MWFDSPVVELVVDSVEPVVKDVVGVVPGEQIEKHLQIELQKSPINFSTTLHIFLRLGWILTMFIARAKDKDI